MKYYSDIDSLPIYNWQKILKGEIEYCRIDISKGSPEEDEKYVDLIKDDYYKAFGLGKDYLRLIELQKELAENQINWIISGDEFLRNAINRLEYEIKELLERPEEEGSMGESLINLSKWVGYRIDVKQVSVREFYNMVNLFKKEAEAVKKVNKS